MGPVDAATQQDAALSNAKDITSFTFLAGDNSVLATDATGTITGTDITVAARFASNITALKATFATTGVTVMVNDTPQLSGVTVNNFTSPVKYTVVADDGSTTDYTVTVTAPSFSPRVAFTTGVGPSSVAVGDLNGDAKPDLAVANGNANTVSVLLDTTATGATSPSFSAKVDFATGSVPGSVAIADLDGDGKLDLAVANQSSNTVSVLLNTTATGATSPSFSTKVDFATGTGGISIATGDFNGDGKLDLAIACNGFTDVVSVLLNTTSTGATTPSFSANVDFTTGTSPFSIAAGDFNADGKPDLVVSTVGGFRAVSVFLNTTTAAATTPTFAAKVDVVTNENIEFVTVGDLNADGKPDLAVTNANPITVLVLPNTTAMGATTPSFAPLTGCATASGSSLSITDMNGDGKLDLAVVTGSATVAVVLNTTAPGATTMTCLPKIEVSTGSQPVSIGVADFNGDDKPDVVVANFNLATVSVLLAQ